MRGLTDQLDAGDDRPDLTPMIDCVFLLLLFFIVTAAFVDETNLFKVELPTAANPEVRKVDDALVVSVSASGQYAVGETLVGEGELWAHLSGVKEEGGIQTFVIKGDKACPYEKVVAAVDMAQALGVAEVTFAVDRGAPAGAP